MPSSWSSPNYLIFKEIEAVGNGDLESAQGFLENQSAFLTRRLGAWIPEFAKTIEENAKDGFYSSLARATQLFVQRDLAFISESSMEWLADMMRE